MIRGETRSVLLAPQRATNLDPFETAAPAHLALRNGTITEAGNWRKRPGMGGGLTCGGGGQVILLIPDDPGYAMVDTGGIYLLSDRRTVVDADLSLARARVVALDGQVPALTDQVYILAQFVLAGMEAHAESVEFLAHFTSLLTYQIALDTTKALGLFPPTTPGWYPRWVQNSDTREGTYRPTYANYDGLIIIADGGRVNQLTYTAATNSARLSLLGGSPPACRFVATLDTYLILAGGASLAVRTTRTSAEPMAPTQFRWSGVNDPDDWDMLTGGAGQDEVAAVGERIEMMKVLRKELYFFLSRSIEVWVNIGAGQVFARQLRIARGTPAGYSVVQANDTFYWFGDDGHFYVLDGMNPRIISRLTRASIDTIRNRGDLYGFDFRREHVIRWFAPVEGKCFVYDYASDLWSEDDAWEGAAEGRLNINAHMEWEDRVYIGDYEPTGRVYEWSRDYHDDAGRPIRVRRSFQTPLVADGTTARVNRLRFRVKHGEGLGNGKAATLLWRYRLDQGDWSRMQEASLGAAGEMFPYVDAYQLGIGRELAIELVETDAVDALVTHALVTAERLGQ